MRPSDRQPSPAGGLEITGELMNAPQALASDDRETQVFDSPPSTPVPLGRAHLIVLEGRHVGRRFPIEGETTIGRGESAQLRIEDPVASRLHVTLKPEAGEWRVEDLGSHNGTLVNGTPVRTQPLRFGDRLQVGETLFLFAHRDPLEERIRHRQKLEMLGRLGAGVAHDINNLLASILANAEIVAAMVHKEGGVSTEVDECLADVRVAARRGAELTRRIVDQSRQATSEDTTVDLSAVVLEASELVRRTFDHSTRIETSIEPAVCVRGNRTALHQVAMNLLVNARDSMATGGVMRVRVSAVNPDAQPVEGVAFAGQYAIIEVQDEGSGISESIRARVFEPFFTTKPADRGSGLGLATVSEIVGEHGGRVSFDSVTGRGTIFRVVLPALSTAGARAPRHTPVALTALGARVMDPSVCVLLVDDDALVRRAVARTLTRDGIRVIEESDGRAALATYADRHKEIGLVLLDLDMPELDGEAAFEGLRAQSPDVRVLFFTGLCDEARKQSLLDRGACGLLAKPCSGDVLRRAVRAELSRPPVVA